MINLWQTFNETLVELFIGISDKGREHSKLIEDREKTTLHQRLKENRHSHSTHRPSPLQPLSIPPPLLLRLAGSLWALGQLRSLCILLENLWSGFVFFPNLTALETACRRQPIQTIISPSYPSRCPGWFEQVTARLFFYLRHYDDADLMAVAVWCQILCCIKANTIKAFKI